MVINYSLPSEVELLSDSSYSVLFRSASVYPLHWSSSFKILLSLFRNFSSGCELTRLCNACEAFFLVSPSLSDWTNCTNNGIQPAKKHYIKYQQILTDTLTLNYKKKKKIPDWRMARQLSGQVLSASSVSPMSTCSWPPSMARRLWTTSILASSCWEDHLLPRSGLVPRTLSKGTPPELEAKLITLVTS